MPSGLRKPLTTLHLLGGAARHPAVASRPTAASLRPHAIAPGAPQLALTGVTGSGALGAWPKRPGPALAAANLARAWKHTTGDGN